jgi:hypothetical protein
VVANRPTATPNDDDRPPDDRIRALAVLVSGLPTGERRGVASRPNLYPNRVTRPYSLQPPPRACHGRRR